MVAEISCTMADVLVDGRHLFFAALCYLRDGGRDVVRCFRRLLGACGQFLGRGGYQLGGLYNMPDRFTHGLGQIIKRFRHDTEFITP